MMTDAQIVSNEAAVVLVGSFNPAIFHPNWFLKNNLIKEAEGDKALESLELVNKNLAIFSIDWLSVVIERERFQISCSQEPFFEASRDFVSGTFQVLSHTPIKKMGINRNIKFQMASEESFHGLGFQLAPKENWSNILPDYTGMKSLSVQSKRSDSYQGNIQVTIAPEDSKKHIVMVSVNDHFDLDEAKNSSDECLQILKSEWTASLKRSKEIIDKVIKLGAR
jgi:hypothetical protein